MKKIRLFCVACLVLVCLLNFASCNFKQNENSSSDKNTTKTENFKLEIIDENNYVINKSSILNAYPQGTLLKFYVNPIMDVDLTMYVNDKFDSIQTSVNYGDGFIWLYTFIMPDYDVKIEFKVNGDVEYFCVKDILNIPSNLSYETIVKVRYEKGYAGVAPGTLTNVQYSIDMEDVNMVLQALETLVYEVDPKQGQIDGGSYTYYSIITENAKYDIRINNGYIFADEKYYKFNGEYVLFEYPSLQTHSFTTYINNFNAYTVDDKLSGTFTGLSDFEFSEYLGENLPDKQIIGYLITKFGKLYVYDENIFFIEENNTYKYYEITGEKNFSHVFTNQL